MIEIIHIRDGIFVVAVHVDNENRVFVAVALTARGATGKLVKIINKYWEDQE